jgi:hypothetical protein
MLQPASPRAAVPSIHPKGNEMEKFTSARAQPANFTPEGPARELPNQQALNEVRALDDWEMALVGGGEDIVCW